MQTMHIKPKPADRTVLNPDNAMRPLLAGGETVPASMYWQHRLRDDVVEAVDPDRESPAPVTVKTAAKSK